MDYVEVSDLATLTHETPALKPIVQHLVLQARAASVVYALSMPALQLLVGAASMQEDTLRQLLQEGRSLTSPIHPTIHVDRLDGQMTMLLSCMKSASQNACWQPVSAQEGPVSYQARGVQLLRYSQAQYSATAQQIAAGQPGEVVAGEDAQGAIYRSLLPQHLALASDGITGFTSATGQPGEVLPLNAPQHMAALPGALQFIPLAQACLVNGKQCYSGLYIRLRRVDSYNSQSLALLQASAAAITARTGLHVDILDGSSTRLVTLVSGHAHSALAVRWRVVGVAVQITRGVDALQNTLFLLCALICLLAIGAAGVLIGIGRRNEARTLEQLGWSNTLRVGVYLCSALLLALPGCALASLLILLAHKFWPGNLPVSIPWGLLAMGIMIYTVSLVSLACGGSRSSSMRNRKKVEQEGKERMQAEQVGEGGTRAAQASEEGMRMEQVGEGGTRAAQALPPFIHTIPAPPMAWLRRGKSGSAFHARITAPLVCSIAISATIFLIAIEYLMVNGLNRELVVTVLGDQVRVVLEGPQLFLLLLVLLTALLTVGLCTSLLLRGRREELALLAKVGWERRHVLLRLLRESWWMAALSGLAGALLALVVITGAGSLPQVWIAGGVLLGGLLVGMALVSLVVYTLARQELQNVYLKRA